MDFCRICLPKPSCYRLVYFYSSRNFAGRGTECARDCLCPKLGQYYYQYGRTIRLSKSRNAQNWCGNRKRALRFRLIANYSFRPLSCNLGTPLYQSRTAFEKQSEIDTMSYLISSRRFDCLSIQDSIGRLKSVFRQPYRYLDRFLVAAVFLSQPARSV